MDPKASDQQLMGVAVQDERVVVREDFSHPPPRVICRCRTG